MPPFSLLYLPPISWFAAVARLDVLPLEAFEHYQKGSYRNRVHIGSANDVQVLSVPLRKGKNERQPIQAVEIDNTRAWQRQHFRSIRAAYGAAPFWLHYADRLEPHYTRPYDTLWAFNRDLLDTTTQLLGWHAKPILETTAYHPIAQYPEATPPIFSPRQPAALPYYPQIFEYKHGFRSDLSILDALFCLGKSTGAYLEACPAIFASNK